MAVYHKEFYKKVIEDFLSFFKSPREFLRNQLENFHPASIDKKWIGFVFFMHVYFILMPSVLISLNFIAILFAFFSIGVFYYMCQICLEKYQEGIAQTEFDSKKLYVFAYAFSLAELVGFILNLMMFLLNLTNIFSIFSWLLGFFFMVPVAIIVFVLKLSVFKVVLPSELSIVSFFQILLDAVVETVKNKFGLNAWKELWADFNSESV
jgi:hypothetical protein